MTELEAYRQATRRQRPVLAFVLQNNVHVFINPTGTQNNIVGRTNAANFLRQWRKRQERSV